MGLKSDRGAHLALRGRNPMIFGPAKKPIAFAARASGKYLSAAALPGSGAASNKSP
jgi:hypothetical protein